MIAAASASLFGLKMTSPATTTTPTTAQPTEIQIARLDGYGG